MVRQDLLEKPRGYGFHDKLLKLLEAVYERHAQPEGLDQIDQSRSNTRLEKAKAV